MRRVVRALHLWIAIPTGVIITIICITGAIMVFQDEILEIIHPQRYLVSPNGNTPLHLDSLIAQVNSELIDDTIQSVQLYSDPSRTTRATLSKGNRNYVYINPYTGAIAGYYNARAGFFHQVMRLHRWMMFSDREVGSLLVGSTTILMVIILISGIIIWVPRTKRQISAAFTIKRNSSIGRRLLDLHRVLGIYISLWLIVLALTGVMWSFEWYRDGVSQILGFRSTQERPHACPTDKERNPSSPSWQAIYNAVERELSDYRYVRIDSKGRVAVLPENAPHKRALELYRYHHKSHNLVKSEPASSNQSRSYLMGWIYAVHVGSWAGVWSQWLTLLVALIGSTLPITGYWLYLRGRQRVKVSKR